jgi:hypothetical protein
VKSKLTVSSCVEFHTVGGRAHEGISFIFYFFAAIHPRCVYSVVLIGADTSALHLLPVPCTTCRHLGAPACRCKVNAAVLAPTSSAGSDTVCRHQRCARRSLRRLRTELIFGLIHGHIDRGRLLSSLVHAEFIIIIT